LISSVALSHLPSFSIVPSWDLFFIPSYHFLRFLFLLNRHLSTIRKCQLLGGTEFCEDITHGSRFVSDWLTFIRIVLSIWQKSSVRIFKKSSRLSPL
jgi:hypothetical protein